MSTATPGTGTTEATAAALPRNRVELAIGGMTCASCAARIEKKLNRMDGVEATVNYATAKALVAHAPEVAVDELIATVERTGYTAEPPRPRTPEPERPGAAGPADPELTALRQRLLVTAALAVPDSSSAAAGGRGGSAV